MQPKAPSEIYDEIQTSAPADLGDRLLKLFREHCRGKANKIGRREMILDIFGVKLLEDEDLANSTLDRWIRDAIAELQKSYPILASSGYGGYWYADSIEDAAEYAGEIRSRAEKLYQKAREIERVAVLEFGPQMKLGI